MRTKSGTALHRRCSLWRRCHLSHDPHRRPLQSLCSQPPAQVTVTAAPRHPAAAQIIATTTGGMERWLTTARSPVPGLALVREMAPPPVDSEHLFRQRPAVTSSGQDHQPHLSDLHWRSRSILPHRSTTPATGPHLITADGQPIPAWGTHKQTLKIGSFHFSFPFVLAAVAFPILGND